MRVHLICATHRTTALVGPGSLLNELECVACIAIIDSQTWRPCCSRANIDCCGHDDGGPLWSGLEIESPDFCDSGHAAEPPF